MFIHDPHHPHHNPHFTYCTSTSPPVQVVDTGLVDPQQALVLAEIRCLLLFLGCEMGLLPPSFAEAVMKTTFCKEVRASRRRRADLGVLLTNFPA